MLQFCGGSASLSVAVATPALGPKRLRSIARRAWGSCLACGDAHDEASAIKSTDPRRGPSDGGELRQAFGTVASNRLKLPPSAATWLTVGET